jgi:hypothetical protein
MAPPELLRDPAHASLEVAIPWSKKMGQRDTDCRLQQTKRTKNEKCAEIMRDTISFSPVLPSDTNNEAKE